MDSNAIDKNGINRKEINRYEKQGRAAQLADGITPSAN